MSELADLARRKPYQVIYADPPWPSGKRGQTASWLKYAGPTYSTMSGTEIKQLPVAQLADPAGSVLALWSTWMHLSLAMETIEAWGFQYVTGMPWLKVARTGRPHFGLGIWFRGCTELLLIGRRGTITNPRPAREGIVIEPRREHSRKPESVRDWLTQGFPKARRLEMFARERAVGWDGWGNEYPEKGT